MFRDVVKGVAKNTTIMLFQQVITSGSTVVLMLFLPRYLGPVEYGRLYLASSIAGILSVFVAYGGSYLIAKSVSRSPQNTGQLLADGAGARSAIALLCLAGMIVFSHLAGYPREVRQLIIIYGLSLLLQGTIITLYACYQGRELMQYTSAGAIAYVVPVTIVSIIALLMGAHATVIAIITVAGTMLQLLVMAKFARNIVTSLPRINWRGAIQQIKEGAPYFLFAAFSVIYYRVDTVLLSKMAPEAVVGWYGGARRLFESLNFLPFVFSIAIYPVLSRLWEEEKHTHKRTLQKSLEFMIIAGVPISVGVIGFADKLIQEFYGLGGYAPSILILQILAVGLLFLYIDFVLGTTLLASDKQRQQSVLALLAIPFNVGLNFLLIPYFQTHVGNGGIGAAIATGMTELAVMITCLSLLPQGVLRGFRVSVVAKSAFAGVLMAASLGLMRLVELPWLVVALASPVIYSALLFLMRTFEPSERRFLQRLLTVQGLKNVREFIHPSKSSFAQDWS
jgi:O-antigen/teichoic acid export membrane protein